MTDTLTLFYITIPHSETGTQIAKSLLEKKLIACANILPAHMTVYEWESKIKEESEHVLILKTRQELASQVETEVSRLHPYDCPCILQINPSHANTPFQEWIIQQTQGGI